MPTDMTHGFFVTIVDDTITDNYIAKEVANRLLDHDCVFVPSMFTDTSSPTRELREILMEQEIADDAALTLYAGLQTQYTVSTLLPAVRSHALVISDGGIWELYAHLMSEYLAIEDEIDEICCFCNIFPTNIAIYITDQPEFYEKHNGNIDQETSTKKDVYAHLIKEDQDCIFHVLDCSNNDPDDLIDKIVAIILDSYNLTI